MAALTYTQGETEDVEKYGRSVSPKTKPILYSYAE